MSSPAIPVAVFAEVTALPGKREDLLAAAREAFPSAEAEEGTHVFAVHVCESEPDVVRFYEVYADAEARAAHSGSEATQRLIGSLGDLIEMPPKIVETTPVIAKGHASDGRG